MKARRLAVCFALLAGAAGCHTDMRDQPRYEALEASEFFTDGQSARPAVPGTVARAQLHEDEGLYTGRVQGRLLADLPVELSRDLLERGRERFNIYCSPCHGASGAGDGMIVQRGFRRPPSYHEERLVNAPVGYLFDVMTNGFGAMQDYSSQVPVADRWAIAAYIRALQFSRRATVNDVPADRRAELDQAVPGADALAPAAPEGQQPQPAQPVPPAQENE